MFALKLSFNLSKQLKIISLYKIVRREKSVRVRFAPSPTGFLHLGGLRTALYNQLFAKSQNGVTILRIEDTDQTRKVESATENLIEDLAWCGITYDEGPYFQSERLGLYQKYGKQLVEQNDAYYCFCSSLRLNLLRREALKTGEIPKYDNKCRHLTKEEIDKNFANGIVPCIRFKYENGVNHFDDIVCGPYSVTLVEGDPVILKADGFPTYHFANVVDDHLMKISHVLRGVEWLISTPKHLSLYRAFKWDPPLYGHLPLLMNEDGTKLSKRQGDVQIRALRHKIMLPNAIVNYIVRFGGGFDLTQDERNNMMFTLEELYKRFDISKVRKNSCKVSLKDLEDYNRAEIIKLLETEEGSNELMRAVQKSVKHHYKDRFDSSELNLDEERIKLVLEFMKCRIHSIEDLLSEDFSFIWHWKCESINLADIENIECLEKLISGIESVEWDTEHLKAFLKKFCHENSLKFPRVMKALRVLLTGLTDGPPVYEILLMLGRKEAQSRLRKIVLQSMEQGVPRASNC